MVAANFTMMAAFSRIVTLAPYSTSYALQLNACPTWGMRCLTETVNADSQFDERAAPYSIRRKSLLLLLLLLLMTYMLMDTAVTMTGKNLAIAKAACRAGFDCSDPERIMSLVNAVRQADMDAGYPDYYLGQSRQVSQHSFSCSYGSINALR